MKEVKLNGLSCANCAAKIENEINKLPDVKEATVDFVNKKLTYTAHDANKISIIDEDIKKIVKRVEPEVKVSFSSDEHEHQQHESHLFDVIRFAIGFILFLVALLVPFSPTWELVIYGLSYLIVGAPVVWGAIKRIIKGDVFSELFLMTIATIGAFALGEYAEGVAVMLFYLVGELFEDLAVDRSRKSIAKLMNIRPDYANVKRGNDLVKVDPDSVQIGDIIVVKPGEKIPLDGMVIEGNATVDTKALTGESLPRELTVNSEAFSGFINKNGVLTIEVTKTFGESTVSKILDLVENASSKKAPTEKFISKFARYYTPVVVIVALFLAILPPLIIPDQLFATWIYRALVFLVVSCPCALVLSIPVGFIGGIGGASKKGILIKGGNYLEALNKTKIVVFDKTGTLTKGEFNLTDIVPKALISKDELLELTAYAESYSTHPIALSILSAYQGKIDTSRVKHYEEIEGQGVKILIDDKEVLAGNPKLMKSAGIPFEEVDSIGTLIHVAVNKQYVGYLVIADEIKEDAIMSIKELKKLGVEKTIMLTGDRKVVGDKVGALLGVDEVHSELLPINKVEMLESLEINKDKSAKHVFVGDGINDAPVLARADIGIAMGGLGSDAAIEAADVVIMNDEPSKVAMAIKIAKRTKRIVMQNIVMALGVKLVFLLLGAFGVATMWEAVFADVGVAILAVLNAMRALNTKRL